MPHAFLANCLGERLRFRLEELILIGMGAISASGDDQRKCPTRMRHPEVQCCKSAHRQANDVRPVDVKAIKHTQ